MAVRYAFGEMIMETGAVAGSFREGQGVPSGWRLEEEAQGGFSLCRELKKQERVYGLGETLRGMDKRGWLYTSNNVDDPVHLEGKHSLYASHNFLLFVGEESFGLFVDNPGKVDFDLGYTRREQVRITVYEGGADVYLIEGENPREVARSFRALIGPSYIPPKWAFGFGQSRWSYPTAEDVREVVRRHREAGVPLDMVYLDIDYMVHYKDFTVDEEAFGDFPAFVKEMREAGIHLVPIIDAGVKIEEGYPVYEEGLENGYFCKKEDGTPLVAAVWPGRVHFPDFLNPEARAWFGDQYKSLVDMGVDGFWNDMNEPAIFYTEDHLAEVFERLKDYQGKNLDLSGFFSFRNLVSSISNNEEDYRRFYHEVEGKKIRHDRVHNLYGAKMTQAAGEAFARMGKEKDILIFSRSSYIGSHRYGGVWTGDNRSWWSHLLLNLQQLPGLSLCGYLYSGADIGGFGDDCTEELLLRWLQLGVFTPLFRNHSALHTREQEIYRFSCWEDMRNILTVRYALIPYLYSLIMQSALNADLMFRPLAFDYPRDEIARHIEDQVMLGPDCMIAPVYEQNAVGRLVYLPEDMLFVRFRSAWDYDCIPMKKGAHYVMLALNEAALFIRRNALLPLCTARVRSTEDLDLEHFRLLGWVTDRAESALYTDNGHSLPESADARTFHFRVRLSENKLVSDSDLPADLSGICTDAEAEA